MTSCSADFTVDPRKLRVLREIQQRGTVTSAAAALHLTPSAISQQVAALTRELGVPLLEKTGRGVRLTGQARLLLTHATVVQAQVERARADLAAFEDGAIGTVAVGSFATGITGLVVPAMEALQLSRPGVKLTAVEADPPDAFTMLDRGELDVVLAVDYRKVPPRSDAHYFRTELLADIFDVALPRGHRLVDAPEITVADLAEETFVTANPGSSCSEVTLAICAAAGFSPDIRHYSADWHAVAALVGVGAGIALIPRLAHPLHEPRLVLRKLDGMPVARNIFAAVRQGSQADPVFSATLAVLVGAAVQACDAAVAA
jgi:DNA-binding transcriptional LysR family regulator